MKKNILILIVFLTVAIIFFCTVPSMAGCKKTIPTKLDVYVWEGYLPEEVAALFEQETGIELNITFISDNDEMLTLLKGGGRADIIMPTQNQVNRYYELSLVQPPDLKSTSNYKKVYKSFKDQPWTKWDGSQMGYGEIYAIPYVFGTAGLVINTSKYSKSLDNIGWEILFNTDLKGRVSSKNNLQSLWMICYLYDIPMEKVITDTQGTMDKVREKVIALRKNVLKFYATGSEIIDLMKNEEVWVSYIEDGGGRKLLQSDAKFKYVLPKEGGVGFTDTFMIPKSAAYPAGANLFIDFMLRPDIAAMITELSGYTTTVEGALDMTKGIDKDLYSYTDKQMANFKWSPNLPEELRSNYYAFWEELTTVQ